MLIMGWIWHSDSIYATTICFVRALSLLFHFLLWCIWRRAWWYRCRWKSSRSKRRPLYWSGYQTRNGFPRFLKLILMLLFKKTLNLLHCNVTLKLHEGYVFFIALSCTAGLPDWGFFSRDVTRLLTSAAGDIQYIYEYMSLLIMNSLSN